MCIKPGDRVKGSYGLLRSLRGKIISTDPHSVTISLYLNKKEFIIRLGIDQIVKIKTEVLCA